LAGHVAHMRDMSNAYQISVRRHYWEDLGADVNIILEWILDTRLDPCGSG